MSPAARTEMQAHRLHVFLLRHCSHVQFCQMCLITITEYYYEPKCLSELKTSLWPLAFKLSFRVAHVRMCLCRCPGRTESKYV